MAEMLPSVIAPEVQSSAESKIFEWFKLAPGTEDWIVLHSLGITNHTRALYSEVDFVVLVPDCGVFALEVKGGRVARKKGRWYFTDKYNRTTVKSLGPFDQAKQAVFSIIDNIKERLDTEHEHLQNIFFDFGVMFPDIEFEATGPDEEQWKVFDSRNGNDVGGYVRSLFEESKRKWTEHYGQFYDNKLPDQDDIKYISSLLRGDFDFTVPLSSQFQSAEEQRIILTQEQYRCLDQLDDNPRCLIRGGAGTGKTLLAIEEAKKSVARGDKTALFCFNAQLADWLNFHFAHIPESLQPDYIGSFHSFLRQITDDQSQAADDDYFSTHLPRKALKAINKKRLTFDKIVVDEAQDLITENYLKVFDASLKKGLDRGQWAFFGDFSMQAIYSDFRSKEEILAPLYDKYHYINFKLTYNCRNTKQICDVIHDVTGFESKYFARENLEGPPVKFTTYLDEKDQKNKLKDLLLKLKSEGIDNEMITILSPRKRESSVVSLISNINNFKVNSVGQITFSTIHSFKGLENTVIIITDIEKYSLTSLMYVALSRAKTALYLFQSTNAAKELQEIRLGRLING